MSLIYAPDTHIVFPNDNRRLIIEHCRQILEAYKNGSTVECKAFGLIFGTVCRRIITVESCFPLKRNVRSQPPYKELMDKIMAKHAIPSVTPLNQRGWVADPAELFKRIKEGRRDRKILLGTYHMHRVGWDHDRIRDTPTQLDAMLGKNSGLLMFIISMVKPERPVIRAFYEGIQEKKMVLQ